MTKHEALKVVFPGLSDREYNDLSLFCLADGRWFSLPHVIHDHIRSGGFRHGIEWRDAHPAQPTIESER